MMRILFLSGWFPFPPSNGSKLRVSSLLRGLAQHHEITLLSFHDCVSVDIDVPEVRSVCREVQVLPWKPFNPQSLRSRLGFLSLAPRAVSDTYSPQMAKCIEQSLSKQPYDLVIASEWQMAGYSRYFRKQPSLFELVELGVLYEQCINAASAWHRFRHGLTWIKHRRYLARLLRGFQACTVASERERQLVRAIANNRETVEVVPNCVNLTDYQPVDESPTPGTLIFTGSFRYFPNYQAMLWFLSEVYPLIQTRVSDVHLIITGDHAGMSLPLKNNVTLTGFVDDVRPVIARSWVSLAPIFQGGGTRLKILEAMALRTPVVATSKGAEGLKVQDGVNILISDTPQAFAEAIIRLLKEPVLRQQLADNAYQLVREEYDWSAVMPRFLSLVERVATNGAGRSE